ncbi:MAG TPA: hypothetical protein VIH57_13585 [Bacteroidales bacterium]
MNCKYINRNLIGYIERSIPIELQEDIDKHLSECLSCKSLFEEVRKTYLVFDERTIPEVNPFFYSKLEHKLRTKGQKEVQLVTELVWKLRSVAATALIFVGVSMGVIIGKSLYGSGAALSNPNRAEILQEYASEYYLTDSGEETMNALISNE